MKFDFTVNCRGWQSGATASTAGTASWCCEAGHWHSQCHPSRFFWLIYPHDHRTFITSVPAITSWSACRFSVRAAKMKPIERIKSETILAVQRPRARLNEIRWPHRSVTFIPSALVPRVACEAELSVQAW